MFCADGMSGAVHTGMEKSVFSFCLRIYEESAVNVLNCRRKDLPEVKWEDDRS